MLLINILILIRLLLNLLTSFFLVLLIPKIVIDEAIFIITIFLYIWLLNIVRILKILLNEWRRKTSFPTSCSFKSNLFDKFLIDLELVRLNIIHAHTLLIIIQMLIFNLFILIFVIFIKIHWRLSWLSLYILKLFLNWLVLLYFFNIFIQI
jgi:hypothetical protein